MMISDWSYLFRFTEMYSLSNTKKEDICSSKHKLKCSQQSIKYNAEVYLSHI